MLGKKYKKSTPVCEIDIPINKKNMMHVFIFNTGIKIDSRIMAICLIQILLNSEKCNMPNILLIK